MSEEEYKDLLLRTEASQLALRPYVEKKDEFAKIAKRLIALLESAKNRIVSWHTGQPPPVTE
jgi:hypothetical protein